MCRLILIGRIWCLGPDDVGSWKHRVISNLPGPLRGGSSSELVGLASIGTSICAFRRTS